MVGADMAAVNELSEPTQEAYAVQLLAPVWRLRNLFLKCGFIGS